MHDTGDRIATLNAIRREIDATVTDERMAGKIREAFSRIAGMHLGGDYSLTRWFFCSDVAEFALTFHGMTLTIALVPSHSSIRWSEGKRIYRGEAKFSPDIEMDFLFRQVAVVYHTAQAARMNPSRS